MKLVSNADSISVNMEDAAYMADLGLEEIRDHDNGMWTWVIEKEY